MYIIQTWNKWDQERTQTMYRLHTYAYSHVYNVNEFIEMEPSY